MLRESREGDNELVNIRESVVRRAASILCSPQILRYVRQYGSKEAPNDSGMVCIQHASMQAGKKRMLMLWDNAE